MGSNPLNLAFRFLLELSALGSVGMWGWKTSEGWQRYGLAIGIPIILALVWATFAVPDDPSRSGSAPVVTSGIIRLIIELAIFSIATWCLFNIGLNRIGLVFGMLVVVHYVLSYDRIIWLLSQ